MLCVRSNRGEHFILLGVQMFSVSEPDRRRASARFVKSKHVDWSAIQQRLVASESQNQWANFGPASSALEQAIATALRLPAGRIVVATSSGTAALFALAGVAASRAGRSPRWLASAFGFASTRIGPLADAVRLIDCDEAGLLDLAAAADVPVDQWDGLLVTNVFGRCSDLSAFTEFCKERGKALILDNAQGLFGLDRSSPDAPNEFISFHHTKPWGFGEGGCAIVSQEDEGVCRSLLNFGYGLPIELAPFAANGKISDLAAAAILARLAQFPELAGLYRRQWQRLAGIAAREGYRLFSELPPQGVLGFVPLQAPQPIAIVEVRNSRVPMAKYYPPLTDLPTARRLYEGMVCLAGHPGMNAFEDGEIQSELRALIATPGGR